MKNPIAGNVKTRLGKWMGNHSALDIYYELVRQTRQLALQFNGSKYLYYSDYIDQNDLWSNSEFQKHLQNGEDLGERMANAFKEVCRIHSHAVIIGIDCPYLTLSHLTNAIDSLKSNQVVIGPAQDGGYYLLGMNEFNPFLFKEINWGSNKVFTQTLQRAEDQNLSVAQMEILSDIDIPADWENWLRYKSRDVTRS
jgi:rSAM/selenodomain-associated transferase 1